MRPELVENIKKIKLLITDVDGVHTDGSYFCGPGGEYKQFNAIDGLGFALARFANFPIAFISGRFSEATRLRAKELKIPDDMVFEGYLNKLQPYTELRDRLKLTDKQIAYVGDDLVDEPVLRKVGVAIAVANAHPDILAAADWVTRKAGGDGAVREIIEQILRIQGYYESAVEEMRNKTYKIHDYS